MRFVLNDINIGLTDASAFGNMNFKRNFKMDIIDIKNPPKNSCYLWNNDNQLVYRYSNGTLLVYDEMLDKWIPSSGPKANTLDFEELTFIRGSSFYSSDTMMRLVLENFWNGIDV